MANRNVRRCTKYEWVRKVCKVEGKAEVDGGKNWGCPTNSIICGGVLYVHHKGRGWTAHHIGLSNPDRVQYSFLLLQLVPADLMLPES